MRRPLFDTGLPFLMTGGNVEDTLLSLTDLRPSLQSHVRALSLWYVVPPGDGTSFDLNARDLDTGDEVEIGSVTSTGGAVSDLTVLPVLDKFPMRGNVEVVVASSEDQVNQAAYAMGYFQVEGERPIPTQFRPLQPSNEEVAANYIPLELSDEGVAQAHAFTSEYIDIVELNLEGTAFATPDIVIADGASLVTWQAVTSYVKLIDGIPFRAASDNNVNGFAPGIHLVNNGGADRIRCWGRFIRG